ncbi:hypothetical protein [Parafrankia sp. EUN1f]|uniref:hypothetical protein n=1 Tax=Parafrankia sp. EUN1f TaxID=102897 RepID=UPI0001C47471|nr:hypothetical protein [Parafrankia sp. EUN1f]EFC80067.1 hypothetical protein FrEUN1fDRAFT_6794 [Parafrankia sp. EUN1f]
MIGQVGLFDEADAGPEVPAPSREQKLAARRRADLARGVHPVTGARLLPVNEGKRCRDCDHLFRHDRAARDYWKCDLNATRGGATDISRRWPACSQFEARKEPTQ